MKMQAATKMRGAVLVTVVVFATGADGCDTGPTGDSNPRPPTPSCDRSAGECPMETGHQPAPSDGES